MVHQEVTSRFWNSAPVFLSTVLVTLSLTLSGCAGVFQSIAGVSQSITASMRKQGEKMVRTPEKTKEKYACIPSRKSMLQLEEVEVLPEVVTPGKEINQRIRYAFCPFTPSGTLKGSITRTVLFKGQEIFHDTTNYEFKPGTWTVDVFIGIPKAAGSGVYTLDSVLKYGSQTIRKSDSFIVKD
jgi:hypothetical protein